MPPRSRKQKRQEPPGGLPAKCKALLRSGAEAAFGDLSGVGLKHLLLQAVNLGERLGGGIDGLIDLSSFFLFDLDLELTCSPRVPALSLSIYLSISSQQHLLGLIITSALMIWKSLILFTGSESPVNRFIFK